MQSDETGKRNYFEEVGRFIKHLWDLAPRSVKREDNTSSPQRQSKLSRIQGSNEDYGKER